MVDSTIVDAGTTPDLADGVGLEGVFCDNTELVAAALKGVEKVSLACGIRICDCAVGKDKLIVDDRVAREPLPLVSFEESSALGTVASSHIGWSGN